MATLKIRYLTERPGKLGPRFFWQPSAALRRSGYDLVRLSDDRMTAMAEAEALNARLDADRSTAPARTAGRLGDIITLYRQSRFYPSNAKTRTSYEQNIRALAALADHPIAAITPKMAEDLYIRLHRTTPSKARAVITMLRMLIAHAVREGVIESSPVLAISPAMKGADPTGIVWPQDALAMMVEAADRLGWPSVGTAMIIAHWLGQRQADILVMKRSDYRDGIFYITQSKTAARVAIPHSAAVQSRVDAQIRRQMVAIGSVPLLICESTGRAWNEHHFRHVFAAIRRSVESEWKQFFLADGSSVATADLQFMHLRHTAVTELAIAGCSALQISGVTGHSIKSVEGILSRYLVRTSDLAASAMAKRSAAAIS